MPPEAVSTLTGVDIGVLSGYFALVIGIGAFAVYRGKRNTVSGYFLAGRSLSFLPIGASLFVSNIGTEHFIGLAGAGAANGISVGAFEFNALIVLQLTGWVFLPVYIACNTVTMPEYLAKRYGGERLRVYYAVLSLVLYIFTKCSGDLFTGALFIQQSLKWDLYVSIVSLVLVTALLTITGGLMAVIYTDTLQAALMIGGAFYLMGAGFSEVGGLSGLLEKYPQAVPTNVSSIVPGTTCHHPDPEAFRMLRGTGDMYMPWLGFVLGMTPGAIWYWCTDQVIVQRALAARNVAHAQGATLMAGFLKILPLFFMVMPGMMARILYPDEVACTNPDYCMSVCQSKTGCSSIAFPRLVMGLMPDGARGLMMAVIVAALMSDLDSIFNSSSALFTIDIWKRIRRRATVAEQMIVGRLFIIVMVAVSIAWVPMIKETQKGQVMVYINEVINYLAPPFAAAFILGVLVPRVNEQGVFWSLMYGLVVGVIRFTLVFVYRSGEYCGQERSSVPSFISSVHYMYFGLFLFLSTSLLAIIISLLTQPPHEHQLENTTLWNYFKRDKEVNQTKGETTLALKVENQDGELPEVDETSVMRRENETFTDKENDDDAGVATVSPSGFKRVLYIILGISNFHESANQSSELKHHVTTMAALKKSKWERTVLNIGLVVILLTGVILFCFFSLYDFPHTPFYPEGAETLLPGDGDLVNITSTTISEVTRNMTES